MMISSLDSQNSCSPLGSFDRSLPFFNAIKLELHKHACCLNKSILILGHQTLPFRALINFKRHISYYEIIACSRGKVAEHAFQIFQYCIGIQCWSATPQGRLSC